jgi:hypothetical protein
MLLRKSCSFRSHRIRWNILGMQQCHYVKVLDIVATQLSAQSVTLNAAVTGKKSCRVSWLFTVRTDLHLRQYSVAQIYLHALSSVSLVLLDTG